LRIAEKGIFCNTLGILRNICQALETSSNLRSIRQLLVAIPANRRTTHSNMRDINVRNPHNSGTVLQLKETSRETHTALRIMVRAIVQHFVSLVGF